MSEEDTEADPHLPSSSPRAYSLQATDPCPADDPLILQLLSYSKLFHTLQIFRKYFIP